MSLSRLHIQMEKPPRPALFDFHGVYMTKYFTENWDNIQNFKARPDDIVIATYPKAGGCIHSFLLFDDYIDWPGVFWAEKMYSSQEPRGSPTSWTCCISGRRLQSARLPSLFMKECHFWRSTYLMDLLSTQVTSLSLYPDNTLHSSASSFSPGLTLRASKEYTSNYTL